MTASSPPWAIPSLYLSLGERAWVRGRSWIIILSEAKNPAVILRSLDGRGLREG